MASRSRYEGGCSRGYIFESQDCSGAVKTCIATAANPMPTETVTRANEGTTCSAYALAQVFTNGLADVERRVHLVTFSRASAGGAGIAPGLYVGAQNSNGTDLAQVS